MTEHASASLLMTGFRYTLQSPPYGEQVYVVTHVAFPGFESRIIYKNGLQSQDVIEKFIRDYAACCVDMSIEHRR